MMQKKITEGLFSAFASSLTTCLLFVLVPSVLQEARHQLTADLQNKMDALDIDMSCLSLTIKSPQISLKTNPTRIPSG